MSIGKFQPTAFNSKAFTMNEHISDTSREFKVKAEGSVHGFLNGFNDADHRIRLNKNYRSDQDNDKDVASLSDSELKQYIHIDVHPNGGASTVHVYQKEIERLSPRDKKKLALLFFREVFSEEPECVAKHVMGIVHDAAVYMPETVSHLSLTRPDLDVKVRNGMFKIPYMRTGNL